jgi:hypothetical protein
MKLFCAFFFAFFCQASQAGTTPAFYVVDVRQSDDAVLHASSKTLAPKSELSYILLDTPQPACCFHFGARKPGAKSPIKIDEDAPPLTVEDGEETFQLPGYVKRSSATAGKTALAFGFEGMTGAKLKAKRSYEVSVAGMAAPVIVRHCLGSEGVSFKLYHAATDKKPYATYYYALGYDVKPDCR